jgi:hypothetical protein
LIRPAVIFHWSVLLVPSQQQKAQYIVDTAFRHRQRNIGAAAHSRIKFSIPPAIIRGQRLSIVPTNLKPAISDKISMQSIMQNVSIPGHAQPDSRSNFSCEGYHSKSVFYLIKALLRHGASITICSHASFVPSAAHRPSFCPQSQC